MIGTKRDIVQLWGREFDIVRQGLSQSQMVAFVNEIINENQTLNERMKHLTYLEKLAGQTVTEADKMAASIKKQAQKEATNIIQASQEEAEEIKTRAREELNQFLAGSREKLGEQLRRRADEVYRRMFSRVEGMLAEVWPPEVTLEFTEAIPEPPVAVAELEDEVEGMLPEEMPAQTLPEETETTLEQPASDTEPDVEAKETTAVEEAAPVSYEGKVDLDILAPIDLAQLMKFRKELNKSTQIKILQITSSQKKGSRISILLTESISLIETLRAMPEVDEAVAETPIETTAEPEAEQTEHVERVSIRLAPVEQA